MRFRREVCGSVLLAAMVVAGGCQSNKSGDMSDSNKVEQDNLAKDQARVNTLKADATTTISRAKRDIEGTTVYFKDAAGYAVFPKITKGGLGIGAAHGDGVVYERRSIGADRVIGTSEVTQGSIGLQIGGQTFSEIIFFEDDAALDDFKKGNAEFDANASGVAGGAGGTAAANYKNGVAVFVFGESGLMGQASIGGQGFSYTPIK